MSAAKKQYRIAAFACDCGCVHIDVLDLSGAKVEHTDIVKALRDTANFIESGKGKLLDTGPHRTH